MMKKNVVLFSIISPLVVLFSVCFLPQTLASSESSSPKVNYVYVEGYEEDKHSPEDFVAFVGSTLIYDVSSSNFVAQNFDGAEVEVIDEQARVTASQPMSTQIMFADLKGFSFVNVEFVEVSVDSLEIVAPYMVNNLTDATFKVCYNGNNFLKYAGEVEYILSLDGQEYTLDSGSQYVKALNPNAITLNLPTTNKATLTVKVGSKFASVDFKVANISLTEVFKLQSNKVTYVEGAENIVVYANLSKNSYANVTTIDDFIKVVKLEKVKTSEVYDTYAITLDVSDSQEETVILQAETTQGVVLRGLTLNAISEINSFEIVSNKSHYRPKDTIAIHAIINGDSELSAELTWYVNGVEHSKGETLNLKRKDGGDFTVYAVLNDVQSNTLSLNVSYQGAALIFWYLVLALAILVFVGLIIFKKKKKNYYVTTNLIDRARKVVPRYNTFLTQYKRRQFRDLLFDVSVLKEDTATNFVDTDDFAFEQAGRALSSVVQDLREIYKADKDKKHELLIEHQDSVKENMTTALECFEEFGRKHPNEKIFIINKKTKKSKKE